MMHVTYSHRVQGKKVFVYVGMYVCIYEDKRHRETAQMIKQTRQNTNKGESG